MSKTHQVFIYELEGVSPHSLCLFLSPSFSLWTSFLFASPATVAAAAAAVLLRRPSTSGHDSASERRRQQTRCSSLIWEKQLLMQLTQGIHQENFLRNVF